MSAEAAAWHSDAFFEMVNLRKCIQTQFSVGTLLTATGGFLLSGPSGLFVDRRNIAS